MTINCCATLPLALTASSLFSRTQPFLAGLISNAILALIAVSRLFVGFLEELSLSGYHPIYVDGLRAVR